jgi:hypothetical protein
MTWRRIEVLVRKSALGSEQPPAVDRKLSEVAPCGYRGPTLTMTGLTA